MWDEVVAGIGGFPDTVLSGRTADGYPFSLRWEPHPAPDREVLSAPRAPGVDLVDGPASLLCHSHDEHLWQLRSVLVRGTLRTAGDRWEFVPLALVPGNGMAGPLGDARSFVAARRRAGRYLRRRGVARPRVPWAIVRRLR